ncbi:molecular chaperone HscC [Deltaproteobacteria bacterium]|nr:molecular chaperone HscC [Deltaproteobacteria bacterium]
MTDRVIGIDLGTTNTVVAVLGERGAEVLRDEAGSALLPSAVAIDEAGMLLVGAAAAARLARAPHSGVRAFKRDMGTERTWQLGSLTLGATELSALVLREAAAIATRSLGEPVRRAVITVPAYFQEPQRAATKTAAELAGLEVVRIVNEPTAAAIAYGALDPTRERRVAVLDLGGGTFDVTLLEVFEGVIQVVGTAGNGRLGGEDFTDALAAWAASEAGLPPEPASGGPVYALLREACEETKHALAFADAAQLMLPGPDPSHWTPGPRRIVSRALFERLCTPLVERVMACVADALARAGWRAESVEEVLLAGGASRMPLIRRRVTERFGRSPVEGPDPDLVVALGAALEAGLVTGDSRTGDVIVTDVLAHSLGVAVTREGKDRHHDGYFMPVLHRNSTLPIRRVERVYTVHPKQHTVTVRVFQGDHRLVEENRLLGQFVVAGLPTSDDKDGPNQAIDLSFAHDLNGLLEVEATTVSTGKVANLVIEQHAGRLTPAQRDAAIAALATLKVHPRDLLPNRLLLELAHTRHARLSPEQRARLDGPLFSFEDALARQDAEAAAQAASTLAIVLSHPSLRPDEP